jgi:murein DD-endopeptidase MepM/ murein hydrolase activator NlpD
MGAAACVSFRAPEPPAPVVVSPGDSSAVITPGKVLDPATLPPRFAPPDSEYFADHPLMVPVEGISPDKLRDTFYEGRDGARMHLSQDILAPRGTPVLAAADGKILRMSQNALGGITVYAVDTEGKYVFYYAHLDHYSDAVTVGLEVKQGDVLGYVGTSGNAPPDTPHLHFQTMRYAKGRHDWWNGTPIDVRPFMILRGEQRQ